jgi:hypothetical protein
MSPRTSEGAPPRGQVPVRCIGWPTAEITPTNQATPSGAQPHAGRYSLMSTRPSRNSPSRRRGMHRRRVTGVPGRAFARRNSSTNCPINHSQVRRGSSGERFGDAGGPGRGSSPPSDRLHPDGHLDRLDGAGPIQNGVGGASLTARTRLSTASPGTTAGSCCALVRTARRSPARQVGQAATETSSYCPLPALRPSCPGGSCRPG